MLRNSETQYGWISIALHWLVALTVVGLFGLGLWMDGLDYYDPWYREAPMLHKGIGALLFLVMIARLAWRAANPRPVPAGTPLARRAAGAAHCMLYLLLFILMLSGYLISTADGRPLAVFDLFEIPATLSGLENQEDVAGMIHEYLAFTLVGLSLLHGLAALKHHFIDRDATLKRMLGVRH